MACLQLTHLLVKLLVLFGQQLLDYGNILLAQRLLNFRKAHAQLLHIYDHIKPRILVNVIIPVPCFRVDIAGL